MMSFLRSSQDRAVQQELAAAVASITVDEHSFIDLLRRSCHKFGTVTSEVRSIRKTAGSRRPLPPELVQMFSESEHVLARNELKEGMALICQVIRFLSVENLIDETRLSILNECANRIEEFGFERCDYFLLALHTMSTGWKVRRLVKKEVLE